MDRLSELPGLYASVLSGRGGHHISTDRVLSLCGAHWLPRRVHGGHARRAADCQELTEQEH